MSGQYNSQQTHEGKETARSFTSSICSFRRNDVYLTMFLIISLICVLW